MSLGPKLVMVVEDDPDCLEALSHVLVHHGYGVVAAVNGLEALRVLRGDPKPALILLDLMMPVMDGWQFLDERSRLPSVARIPVALLSGEREQGQRARDLGVLRSIQKPVELQGLLAAVQQLIGPPN